MTQIRGVMNGEVTFSFRMDQHSRGVCILINPSCSYTVESLNKDQNGRIISINLSSGSANISLCNIYAPNDLQQQLAFLRNLNNFLITNVDMEISLLAAIGMLPWKLLTKKVGPSGNPPHTAINSFP